MSTAQPLIERRDEMHALQAAVTSAADGRGSVLALTGAPGTGKSTLLEHWRHAAAAAGLLVLTARATELERGFAFGVARQLFEPLLRSAGDAERARLLDGMARLARPAVGLDAPASPDVHATIHGLSWLLANIAAERPVLVAVDDAQWADEPSLRWLAYAARRVDAEAIVIAAAASTGDPPPSAELEALLDDEQVIRLALRPFSPEGVTALLRAAFERAPDPAFAAACHRLTGGDPFLLVALVEELQRAGVGPDATAAGVLADAAPDRVAASIRRRLSRLDDPARQLADAVAVLGGEADLPLAAELAGLDEPGAARAATALIALDLFADAETAQFRHPLVRTVVEAAMPAPQRVTAHARAAELLAARHAPSGRIAMHLLAAGPGRGDRGTVARLRAAARDAAAQGVPVAAARLLRRALDEPVAPDGRAAVLRELGAAELAALDDAAVEHLELALGETTDPQARAEIALDLLVACFHAGRIGDGVRTALAVIDEIAPAGELREPWLRLEALVALIGRYDLDTEPQLRGRIHRLADTLDGATVGERAVLATAASERPGTTAADLMAATRRATAVLAERPWNLPADGIGETLMLLHADAPDEATAFVADLIARAHADGSPVRHAYAVTARGLVALDVGALPDAATDLDEALAVWRDLGELDQHGESHPRPVVVGLVAALVQLQAERGDFDHADATLSGFGLAGDVPQQMLFNGLLYARGLLRLRRRQLPQAVADLRELGRRHEAWGLSRPSPPWRSSLALALIGEGEAEAAGALAADELTLAQAWGTPRSIARASRALALASGDPGATLTGLSRAEALLADGPWRLDRAWVRCDLGAALRRAGERREARRFLTLALDEAHTAGAEVLARLATAELHASGARPRRRAVTGRDALTPSERRVAALAAAGRSNREVAQELFVTMATVETHLSRVYRKLDIGGRAELEAALSPGSP